MLSLKALTNGDTGFSQEIKPLIRTASVDGAGVDLKGYASVDFIINAGTCTDGTHTIVIEESATGAWGGEESAVADADLDGTEEAITSSNDDQVFIIRYLGDQRYVRCTIVTTGSPSTGATVGVVAVRHHPGRYNAI